jgi:hypothetical protein
MKTTIHLNSILKNSLVALLVATFAFSVSSCEKDDTSEFVDIAKVTSLYASTDIYITYNFSVLYRVMNDTALMHTDTAIIDSALVTRFADSGGLVRYVVDYGEQTIAHDQRTKSGKIEVSSYPDSMPDGALAYASLNEYAIDGVAYYGTMKYIRTGEVVAGKPKFIYEISVACEYPEGKVGMWSTKEIFLTAGAAEPLKFDLLKFDMMFESNGFFAAKSSLDDIITTQFSTESENPWTLNFGCAKIFRPVEATIEVTSDDQTQTLIETLIDTDLDGCVDKVMLINDKNFGFPFYI